MGIRRFNAEAPVRSQIVDVARVVTLRWLQWFQEVGNAIQAVTIVDTVYDPPSVAAGSLFTVTVNYQGVTPQDFVRGLSFSPMAVAGVPTTGIRLLGNVTDTDTVSVTFFNVSGGAIDLDSGTLRIEVEKVA
jgi:hypothetical protein